MKRKLKNFQDAFECMKNAYSIETEDGVIYKQINAVISRQYGGSFGESKEFRTELELQDAKTNSITIVDAKKVQVVTPD